VRGDAFTLDPAPDSPITPAAAGPRGGVYGFWFDWRATTP
jgi:hypothetical protein